MNKNTLKRSNQSNQPKNNNKKYFFFPSSITFGVFDFLLAVNGAWTGTDGFLAPVGLFDLGDLGDFSLGDLLGDFGDRLPSDELISAETFSFEVVSLTVGSADSSKISSGFLNFNFNKSL